MRILLSAALLVAISGCASIPKGSVALPAASHDWRAVVTDSDRNRLRDWRASFAAALARARAGGHAAEVASEGRLLDPDAAIPGAIPNGRYRCRVIKLGARSEGLLDYIAYPAFACRVQQERDVQGFAKLTGSQRPVGLIFPSDAMRQVFLGALVLGDETRTMQYGRDPERDVAAWVERIDQRRWRMVLPAPRFESLTDVIELIPEQ
ncbi:MAG: DUF4893 domain-containing protein [Sphingomonas bacterium]|nr:DUF4893 domain-containing protein [Sphingomonas bacterium]